jgi:putative phosphoribosyl transferase
MRFSNREDAGRQLADLVEGQVGPGAIVLALPRGGVPVAAEVAQRLKAPLDVLLVRKLGVPGHEELAMGAIASGGVRVFNEDLLARLNIDPAEVEQVQQDEWRELQRRERLYRGDRPLPALEGREVVLIDDGLATGASMRAALMALRQYRPSRIIVAVPVAPPETVAELEGEADQVICLLAPDTFFGVGAWYDDFTQTTDDEVRALLQR